MKSICTYTVLMLLLWSCGNGTLRKSKYPVMKDAGEMPILAWHSIPAEETTLERFREMKETGINHSFSSYPNVAAVQQALDVAAKSGVKIIISCPELADEPEKTVRKFMKHRALAGYYLRDEPHADDFAALGTWARRIQAVDNEHYCYLNLLPTYASLEQLRAKSYRDYVQRYIQEVPTQILSYDHYSVVTNGSGLALRDDYFQNLEIFSDESRLAGKPFWAFALAVAHEPYPIPNLAQIRLQMYSNLAYGAQGLQYFTYWTPGKNPNWNFHHGPIGLDGKRTDVFDKMLEMNKEIKALTPVFLGGKVIGVHHIGSSIPLDTKRLITLPAKVNKLEMADLESQTKQSGALVSEILNGQHRYLVIVNRSFQERLALEIGLDRNVKRIMKDGTIVPASLYGTHQLIEPGDLLVYRLD